MRDKTPELNRKADLDQTAEQAPSSMLQFKQALGAMSYDEQVAAIQPPMPIQFNAHTVQFAGRGQTREAQVRAGQPPSVELHGFRGVREVRRKKVPKFQSGRWTDVTPETLDPANSRDKTDLDEIERCHAQDPLIIFGHIGVSADHGNTIYGLTPDLPEGMTGAQLQTHLRNHTMTFPGVVNNDKPVFDKARNYAASRQWNTDVVVAARQVTTGEQADTLQRLQQLAGATPGSHGIYYSFPLRNAQDGQYFVDSPGPDGKIVKGENQGNCATFPGFIDIALPERSGNLRYYMKALESEASGSSR